MSAKKGFLRRRAVFVPATIATLLLGLATGAKADTTVVNTTSGSVSGASAQSGGGGNSAVDIDNTTTSGSYSESNGGTGFGYGDGGDSGVFFAPVYEGTDIPGSTTSVIVDSDSAIAPDNGVTSSGAPLITTSSSTQLLCYAVDKDGNQVPIVLSASAMVQGAGTVESDSDSFAIGVPFLNISTGDAEMWTEFTPQDMERYYQQLADSRQPMSLTQALCLVTQPGTDPLVRQAVNQAALEQALGNAGIPWATVMATANLDATQQDVFSLTSTLSSQIRNAAYLSPEAKMELNTQVNNAFILGLSDPHAARLELRAIQASL